NWLDGKAAYEIDETGPNQPVKKGDCLDPVKGVWQGINEYVYANSHKALQEFCAYSIMDRPMTSCGCFEVICAYVPECNGIMVVNREFTGDTPIGMTFSTIAGNVGGGQQTPGFMGCGKVFLTSRKFLFAEGGHKRVIWMPKELKTLLADDLKKRFAEQGAPDLLDKIADESIATDPNAIKAHMQKVGHPALTMDDMGAFAQSAARADNNTPQAGRPNVKEEPTPDAASQPSGPGLAFTAEQMDAIKAEISAQVRSNLTREIVQEIINTLSHKFLGAAPVETAAPAVPAAAKPAGPTAAERIGAVKTFAIKREKCEVPISTVTLGSKTNGGTRKVIHQIGGATCMPFHLWEGEMPHRPLVAMEVFDVVGEKYPSVLRQIYGDLLADPVAMARTCVEKFGADLISVRLEGTHPEKGNRSAKEALDLVKAILAAVDVPLIITGHNNFDRINEVVKTVAQGCAGENLLLNWVETDNYRTIAGAAMAYGHTLVAQSPIDVNMAKQLNILLSNMDIKPEQIVMDPMTGALGYGLEYSYSVMERIRLTALGGDKMLAGPMILSPGQECAKTKELKADATQFPNWGDVAKRAALWELTTATSFLHAGADIVIMYHPEAAKAVKRTISDLMDRK
ncbi:MAG: acetyl-CoA decarbonylase/synthase complex subunit delta, partial [Planctomycetes bacterium]|nr:acetyl-CoA decarbonylase/synthase complex subunit delta [Planctomycetota bacterium]